MYSDLPVISKTPLPNTAMYSELKPQTLHSMREWAESEEEMVCFVNFFDRIDVCNMKYFYNTVPHTMVIMTNDLYMQVEGETSIVDLILGCMDLDEDCKLCVKYIISTFILKNPIETWASMSLFFAFKEINKLSLAKMIIGKLPIQPKMYDCLVYFLGTVLNAPISIICGSCIYTSIVDGTQDSIISPNAIILVSRCGYLGIIHQKGWVKHRLGYSLLYEFQKVLKEEMALRSALEASHSNNDNPSSCTGESSPTGGTTPKGLASDSEAEEVEERSDVHIGIDQSRILSDFNSITEPTIGHEVDYIPTAAVEEFYTEENVPNIIPSTCADAEIRKCDSIHYSEEAQSFMHLNECNTNDITSDSDQEIIPHENDNEMSSSAHSTVPLLNAGDRLSKSEIDDYIRGEESSVHLEISDGIPIEEAETAEEVNLHSEKFRTESVGLHHERAISSKPVPPYPYGATPESSYLTVHGNEEECDDEVQIVSYYEPPDYIESESEAHSDTESSQSTISISESRSGTTFSEDSSSSLFSDMESVDNFHMNRNTILQTSSPNVIMDSCMSIDVRSIVDAFINEADDTSVTLKNGHATNQSPSNIEGDEEECELGHPILTPHAQTKIPTIGNDNFYTTPSIDESSMDSATINEKLRMISMPDLDVDNSFSESSETCRKNQNLRKKLKSPAPKQSRLDDDMANCIMSLGLTTTEKSDLEGCNSTQTNNVCDDATPSMIERDVSESDAGDTVPPACDTHTLLFSRIYVDAHLSTAIETISDKDSDGRCCKANSVQTHNAIVYNVQNATPSSAITMNSRSDLQARKQDEERDDLRTNDFEVCSGTTLQTLQSALSSVTPSNIRRDDMQSVGLCGTVLSKIDTIVREIAVPPQMLHNVSVEANDR